MKKIIASLLCCALLLSGCSDKGGESGADTTTSDDTRAFDAETEIESVSETETSFPAVTSAPAGAGDTEYKGENAMKLTPDEFKSQLILKNNVYTAAAGSYELSGELVFDGAYSGALLSLSGVAIKADAVRFAASNIVVTGMTLEGALYISSSECAVKQSTVKGDLYAENADNLLAAKCVITGGCSISSSRNAVALMCETGSLSFDGCRDITAASNSVKSLSLNNVAVALVTGNGIFCEQTACTDVYGGDIPGALAGTDYVGADESLLPVNDLTRFEGMERRAGILRDNGRLNSPSDYITGIAMTSGEIIIPPGVYSASQLTFAGLSDITVYAYGALFIFDDYTKYAINNYNSSRVSVYGLTVDFENVPNAQGTVLSNDGHKVVWLPDEGYGFDILDSSRFAADAAAEGFREGSDIPFCDIYFGERVKNADGSYTLTADTALKPNDRLTFRGLFSHVLYAQGCSDILYEDVTLWAGSGFGFCEYYSEGGTVLNRVMMIPGPAPEGCSEARMLSVCDATHSTNVRRGITVTNCRFLYMTDDAANVNGTFSTVSSFDSTTRTVHYDPSTIPAFKAGDRVWIMTLSGKMLLDTVAVSDSTADGSVVIEGTYDGGTRTDFLIENVSVNGGGFLYENNVVGCNRSRGLLIKSTNGALKNNTVINCGMTGILLKPEISDNWGECGYTENVEITGNLITGCGYFNSSVATLSPITVASDGANSRDTAFHSHRSTVIRNNRVENCGTLYSIYIQSASGAVIEGNDVCGDIMINGSSNITVADNTAAAIYDNSEK